MSATPDSIASTLKNGRRKIVALSKLDAAALHTIFKEDDEPPLADTEIDKLNTFNATTTYKRAMLRHRDADRSGIMTWNSLDECRRRDIARHYKLQYSEDGPVAAALAFLVFVWNQTERTIAHFVKDLVKYKRDTYISRWKKNPVTFYYSDLTDDARVALIEMYIKLKNSDL